MNSEVRYKPWTSPVSWNFLVFSDFMSSMHIISLKSKTFIILTGCSRGQEFMSSLACIHLVICFPLGKIPSLINHHVPDLRSNVTEACIFIKYHSYHFRSSRLVWLNSLKLFSLLCLVLHSGGKKKWRLLLVRDRLYWNLSHCLMCFPESFFFSFDDFIIMISGMRNLILLAPWNWPYLSEILIGKLKSIVQLFSFPLPPPLPPPPASSSKIHA